MMMDDTCIELMDQELKSETRRIKRNNKRPAVPGHIHLIKKDRTKNVYGKILITDVYVQNNIYDVSEDAAKREGFKNRDEFLEYWLATNSDYAGEEIWVVEFIVLNKSGLSAYVAEAMCEVYKKNYKDISFEEYLTGCTHITTLDAIKNTNEKYQKTINDLCNTGKAIYIWDNDNIVFLNWDICHSELIRNFAIVW